MSSNLLNELNAELAAAQRSHQEFTEWLADEPGNSGVAASLAMQEGRIAYADARIRAYARCSEPSEIASAGRAYGDYDLATFLVLTDRRELADRIDPRVAAQASNRIKRRVPTAPAVQFAVKWGAVQ